MATKMAKKKPAAKSAASKTAKKPAMKKASAKKPAKKGGSKPGPARASNIRRTPWFDAAKGKPVIGEYAQRLQTYIDAMADGQVEERELQVQEGRLIASMKEVEPLLDGPIHAKVTRLLCELAAYDMMQALSALQAARPKTVFKG